MLLEEKAKLVASQVQRAPAIDEATIQIVLLLIKEIIALYLACYRPAAMAATNMNKPGIVSRRRLKKLIEAQHLPEGITTKDMQTAFLKVGESMTAEEVSELYLMVKPK